MDIEFKEQTKTVKRWIQIVVLICLAAGIAVMLFVADFAPEPLTHSENRRVAYVQDGFAASIDDEGRVAVAGEPPEEYDFSGWDDIVSLAAGEGHIAGVRGDHTVVMTGPNAHINGVSDWQDIVMVALAPMGAFGLREDGTVAYAGDAQSGGLVDVARVQDEVGRWRDIVYIDAGTSGVAGVTKDGEVVIVSAMPQVEKEARQWTDIKMISMDEHRVIAITTNGAVIVCEQPPDGDVLCADPYPLFEGAVKVCSTADVMACLMQNGTVRVSAGLAAKQQQTRWEGILFSIKYGAIDGAKSIVDIDSSDGELAVLKSSGTVLVK